MSKFSTVATQVIDESNDDLVASVRSVQPVLRELADAGDALTGALGNLSFPFPIDGAGIVFQGDYINFFATVDLTIPTLQRDFLAGTPLDGLLAGLTGQVPSVSSRDVTDPVRDPVKAKDGDGEDDAGDADGLNDLLQGLSDGLTGKKHKTGKGGDGPVQDLVDSLLGGVLGGES